MTTEAEPGGVRVAAGEVIAGRYRLGREIGRGGMGAVYRAVQLELGRPVAIKFVLGPAARDDTSRARFRREAKVASLLRHPGAVEIYDFGEHDGVPFLVMELVSGRSLLSVLQTAGGLSYADVASVGAQVADVLVAAHDLGLVHRDLKPENLIVSDAEEGALRVKLIDFGLAFIDGQGELGRLTREAVLSGTPHYLAPEQAQARPVGPPADIYALGVMLFLLVSRQLPFQGTVADLIAQHAYNAPPRLDDVVPGCPVPLSELVERMLKKRPAERPTAAQVRDALKALDPEAPARLSRVDTRGEQKTGRFAPSVPVAIGREARVLATAPGYEAATADMYAPADSVSDKPCLASTIELAPSLLAALGTRGWRAQQAAPDAALELPADVWLLPSSEVTKARCAQAVVIALYPAGDLEMAHKLLRLGVAEAVAEDADPGAIARKVVRAWRRASLRSERGEPS
jgi:hypothetical protein